MGVSQVAHTQYAHNIWKCVPPPPPPGGGGGIYAVEFVTSHKLARTQDYFIFLSHCVLKKYTTTTLCPPPPPPAGEEGGGGVHAYWVCAARETPIFSPKLTIRSISFSQMSKYSEPEHHHFTFFGVPDSIIFEIYLRSIAAHGRLTQPSSPSSLRSPALSRSSPLELAPELPVIGVRAMGLRGGVLQPP